jgi:integrase/recombinase XerD
MTPLRQRRSEDLQLRGLSERTQEMYVRAVRQLAEHDHKSPDRITEEELRDDFLSLKKVKHYSRSASTIALCGLKFFYEPTLPQAWTTRPFVRPPREKQLPVILSVTELRTLLAHLKRPRYRGCLTTIYACGLRLQEGTHLPVTDLDAARMRIHVRHGKGAKDRDVPRPQRTLPRLRSYGVTHRTPVWIFPAPGRAGTGMSPATQPLPRARVQEAFRAALTASGLPTRASVHTLRHSWAPHRLEAGVNLRLIQASLGHSSPATTSVDTHLTIKAQEMAAASINRLMEDLSW